MGGKQAVPQKILCTDCGNRISEQEKQIVPGFMACGRCGSFVDVRHLDVK